MREEHISSLNSGSEIRGGVNTVRLWEDGKRKVVVLLHVRSLFTLILCEMPRNKLVPLFLLLLPKHRVPDPPLNLSQKSGDGMDTDRDSYEQ